MLRNGTANVFGELVDPPDDSFGHHSRSRPERAGTAMLGSRRSPTPDRRTLRTPSRVSAVDQREERWAVDPVGVPHGIGHDDTCGGDRPTPDSAGVFVTRIPGDTDQLVGD
jgi:hypothetical protein